MKETTFMGIKPQLVKMGFNDEILAREQWDSYNQWNIRDRQVKNGQKSTSLKLKMRNQILDTETGKVLSESDFDRYINVFHHSQTDPVDKTGILEDVGNFDRTYEWTYNRDVNYCLSAREKGWKIYQVPTRLMHLQSQDNKRIATPQNREAETRNRKRVKKKWQNTKYWKTLNKKINE